MTPTKFKINRIVLFTALLFVLSAASGCGSVSTALQQPPQSSHEPLSSAAPVSAADSEASATANIQPGALAGVIEAGLREGMAAQGYTVDKGTTRLKPDAGVESLSVGNENGSIDMEEGEGNELVVHMVVTVYHATKEEAEAVAGQVELKVNRTSSALEFRAVTKPSGAAVVTVQLTVTLPKGMKAGIEGQLENGNIILSHIASTGKIRIKLENGKIAARDIAREMALQLENGSITVTDANSKVSATAENGTIQAERIAGPLEMRLANGTIGAKEAASSVTASSDTGKIKVESGKIGGDWNVSANIGVVELAWPEQAGVEVAGKVTLGTIDSDFPLTIDRNRITGKIGDGRYRIQADAFGKLSLRKAGATFAD